MSTKLSSATAFILGLALVLPNGALAQQPTPTNAVPLAGETALEFAERINACDERGLLSAEFENDRTVLSVRCSDAVAGMSGGLGGGAAIAAGLGIIVLAFAVGGGGSSSTTTTN